MKDSERFGSVIAVSDTNAYRETAHEAFRLGIAGGVKLKFRAQKRRDASIGGSAMSESKVFQTERWYWPMLVLKSAWYYLHHGRILAMFRTLLIQVVQHNNGETCQICGRDYVLWRAPDEMYEEIVGHLHGLYCPWCFDCRARDNGLILDWQPKEFRRV